MKVNSKSLDYIDKILMRLDEAAEDDAAETDATPEQDTDDNEAPEADDEAAFYGFNRFCSDCCTVRRYGLVLKFR